MPLTQFKVTAEEQAQQGVVAEVGKKLNGSVQENKAVFDRLCNYLITKYNQVLDLIYTKEETNAQINAKITEIGSGDMAMATYDPTMQKKDIFAEIAKKSTADESGSALSAVKLKSPRKINGVNFNGEADIIVSSNTNILDNACFKTGFLVNQRGITTTSQAGAVFDRWKLSTGTVTVTDGGIVLNGTLIQILETAVGTNVTASCSAGTASYDNTTKTFTLVGTGQTIEWAKLEYGTVSTRFDPVPYSDTLLKCQRYYVRLNYSQYDTIGNACYGTTWLNLHISLPVTLRIESPTTTVTCQPIRVTDSVNLPTLTNAKCRGSNLNVGYSISGNAGSSYIYASIAGYIEIGAEL